MLRLRPYKKCDAPQIISWIKDEVSFRKWCADRYETYPIKPEDMNAKYAATEDSDTFFPMTAFDESGESSYCSILGQEWRCIELEVSRG